MLSYILQCLNGFCFPSSLALCVGEARAQLYALLRDSS
jgi:hypothetical protein